MTWDETDGWIFSDDYHAWQEAPRRGGYRPGTAPQVRDLGWYIGLWTEKPLAEDGTEVAQWPEPLGRHDLDMFATGMAGLTP